ncbi:MBOAT family O-acyltransferase [Allomuricauda sp. R78024]|uniref:MBOAT family O-acyltransferase n=1 Tax=Allomuricauda sp. R78024 TaxID=3093867 RepID=UPI0037C6BC3E
MQNLLLLLASYMFYGWWDWRFLLLILFSTLVDFIVGQWIYRTEAKNKRRYFLWISVICNIGILAFFKYFNFFTDSFIETFRFLGFSIHQSWTLKIILPVGISFYTFQTMSYSLDVYKKKLIPTKDFISFATYVSFFPQLVAGPIERASNLLPQILKKREFKYSQIAGGLRLILWGLFKKIAIADSLAPMVDDIFNNAGTYPSTTLLMGALFFGFQIYGDFSGYSDIAIGTAKLFGIELMSNFKFPYFSRSIGEFWRRWHISLSTWFRDYLYIPLGGSKVEKIKVVRNIFIIFLVSGLWHGANWTFVFWGGIHAMLFAPTLLLGNNRKYTKTILAESRILPSLKELILVLGTFFMVTITWVFFRADSLSGAFAYLGRTFFDFSYQPYLHPKGYRMIDFHILLGLFVIYEYIIRKNERSPFNFSSKVMRFIMYALIAFGILLFYESGVDRSFIYFQF